MDQAQYLITWFTITTIGSLTFISPCVLHTWYGFIRDCNGIDFVLVFGAVIGKQTGRSIELLNSFELVTTEVDGNVIIDGVYYETKSEQCKYQIQNIFNGYQF